MNSNHLCIEADPSDPILCPSNTTSNSTLSGFNNSTTNGSNNTANNTANNTTINTTINTTKSKEWEKIANRLGFKFILEVERKDGIVTQGSVALLHVRFTAKTPQYNAINNVMLRLRLKYGTTSSQSKRSSQRSSPMYKSFVVHGRVDSGRLTLCNYKHTPLRGKGLEFSLVSVGSISEQIIYITNSGTFPSSFFVSQTSLSSSNGSFTIYPKRGIVQAKNSKMIKITFSPTKDGTITCMLRIRTNAAAPQGGENTDAYNSQTQILETRLNGKGGIGLLEMHFVTVQDRNLHGLDYGSVLNDHDVSRTIVIRNKGSVPVGFTARVRSPFYRVRRLKHATVKKENRYYTVHNLPPSIESGAYERRRKELFNEGKGEKKKETTTEETKETEAAEEAEEAKEAEEADQTTHVNATLAPGQTMPLSVVLSAINGSEHHAYLGLLIISTLRKHSSINNSTTISKHEKYKRINNDDDDDDNNDGEEEEENNQTRIHQIKEQHLTAPLRGQGGTVELTHFNPIHFGIIPLNNKRTRSFHLFNLGTLPCGVSMKWKIKTKEIDRFQESGQQGSTYGSSFSDTSTRLLESEDPNDERVMNLEVDVGHTVLLRTLGTSFGRKQLWKRAYRWVVNMLRIERSTKRFVKKKKKKKAEKRIDNEKTGEKNGGKTNTNKTVSMNQLKNHAKMVSATKNGNEKKKETSSMNPFEQLRRTGDRISANTENVVQAYEQLRLNVRRNFNLQEEMSFDDDDQYNAKNNKNGNSNSIDDGMNNNTLNNVNPADPADPDLEKKQNVSILTETKREISLTEIMKRLNKARHEKQHLYRVAPPATTPHLRVFPSTMASISHSVHGTCDISLNLSRPGKFEATLMITPIGLPGAKIYCVPLIAYGESVALAFTDSGPLDYGIIAYGEKKIFTRILSNTGRVNTTFLITSKCTNIICTPHSGTLLPKQNVIIQISFIPDLKSDTVWRSNQLNKTTNDSTNNSTNNSTNKSTNGIRNDFVSSELSSVTGAVLQLPIVVTGSHSKRDQTIQVYGNGGEAKIKFSTETMEFDRCMLRRPTTKELRVTNVGTAILTITNVRLNASESTYASVFRKGDTFPSFPITIQPNGLDCLTIPIVFEPPLQQQFTSLLTIETAGSTSDCEVLVRGQGRAVDLAVSTDALSFLHTIVGNSYETSIQVKNTGDLPYALTMTVISKRGEGENDAEELLNIYKKENQDLLIDQKKKKISLETKEKLSKKATTTNYASRDILVSPSTILLSAFSREKILLTYTPSLTTDTEVLLCLESSHALVEIPIRVLAGVASLNVTELLRSDDDGDGIPDYLDLDSSSSAIVESKGVPVDEKDFKGIQFGHFQIDPSIVREKTLYLRNTGSVAFSYRIKRASRKKFNSTKRIRRNTILNKKGEQIEDIIEEEEDDENFPIRLSHWSGRLGPGDDQEVYVRVSQTKERRDNGEIISEMRIGKFREELYVETELRGKVK